jgi:small subunit ribosomal protein S9
MEITNTLGRRKTSVARIYVTPGTGKITVNDRTAQEYFSSDILDIIIKQPLTKIDAVNKFDINANVTGGGVAGQAEAIRLAIARAMVKIDPEKRVEIKKEGFLTRDPRMVERKKYGRRKARRRFQFSKR